MAAATPADRDRWADALRAGSLLVVILGHWLMVAVTPAGEITNTLKLIPWLQPVTWVLQVMPLFFLVGGVAHAYSLDSLARRGGTGPGAYAAFIGARAARLLRPRVCPFLGVTGIGFLQVLCCWHAVGEGDGEGVQGRLPPSDPSCLPEALGVQGPHDQVERLAGGLLGREVALGVHGAPEPGVQALDRYLEPLAGLVP